MAVPMRVRDARMATQRVSGSRVTSHGRRAAHVARAGSTSAVANQQSQQPSQQKLLVSVVEALFKFPPLFELARQNARDKIVQRGLAIGDDWNKELAELQQRDWSVAISDVTDPSIQYPSYYTQPFHAYPKGNLSLDAALEVTLAAKSVHATVMDPNGKQLDPEGDHRLRSNYGDRMQQLLAEAGVEREGVRRVLDLGAATGLSSLALARQFPGAEVVGLDLSPYFVAVGRYMQQQREAASGKKERVQLVHGLAEATGQAEGSFDLVSACLVFHELPQDAAKNIIREAYRVLRPGGVLSIMEMNPASPIWQRIFGNPFAYAAFKSTEPYLQEYVALDLHQAIKDAGFTWVQQKENSPRHRTVVAVKGQ